jgi:hypothetical protein
MNTESGSVTSDQREVAVEEGDEPGHHGLLLGGVVVGGREP